MAEEEKKELSAFDQLIEEMRENNRSTFEIEKDGRNSRRHLLESKKELALQTTALNKIADNIGNMEPPEPPPPPPKPKKDTEGSREDKKLQQAILKGIKGVGAGIKNLAGKFKDNAGFLAGLAGIALAVFDPKKLKEIIDRTVGAIVDSFNIITKIFEGDFSGALEIFSNNMGDIAKLIGVLAIFNIGRIIAFLGAIKKGFLAVFGAKGAIAGVAAFFGVGSAAAFGIIIAAAAAIGVVIVAIKRSIEEGLAVFKDTGSIFEAVKATIFAFPGKLVEVVGDLLKFVFDGIVFLIKGLGDLIVLGFEKLAIGEKISGILTSIGDFFTGCIDFVKNKITEAFELIPKAFSKVLSTITGIFDSLVNRLKIFGRFTKAILKGSAAAVAAAVPGGRSPKEAFRQTYKKTMAERGSGGGGGSFIDNLSTKVRETGDSIAEGSKEIARSAAEKGKAVINNISNKIDNSDNSQSSQTASYSSGRSRDFGNRTESAYQ